MTEQARVPQMEQRGRLDKARQIVNRAVVAGVLLGASALGVNKAGEVYSQPIDATSRVTVLKNCPPDYDSRKGETVRWSSPGIMSSVTTGDVEIKNSVVVGTNKPVGPDNDGSTGEIVVSLTETKAFTKYGSNIQPCVANNETEGGKTNKLEASFNTQFRVLDQKGCDEGAGCTGKNIFQEIGRDSQGRKVYDHQFVRHLKDVKWVIPQGK